MNAEELAGALAALGCPAASAVPMAAQLIRKARMDAERKGISDDLALKCLVDLMAQGWAAAATKNP